MSNYYHIVDETGTVVADLNRDEYNKALVALNESEPTDTEIISVQDPTIKMFMVGEVPYHIKKLQEKGLSPDLAEWEYGLFTGQPAVALDDFINTDVVVLGAAIIPHGPYKGKSDHPGDPLRPGYLKLKILTDQVDNKGNNIVIETSGTEIFAHFANSLNLYGWYLWKEPQKYHITKGGKNGAFFMRNVARRGKLPQYKEKVS